MKLTKDQIQKIALGVMMLFGVVYAYFEFLLTPLKAARMAAIKETAALDPKIDAARAQMAKTAAVEKKSPEARQLLDRVKAMIPDGSPVAWVPTKVSDIFKRDGVEKTSVRMVGEVQDKELHGFSRYSWTVDVPSVEFVSLGNALSALENLEPLMDIQAMEIEAGRENVQFQRAAFTLNNLVGL
jgi:hypothetical protein